MRTLPSTMTRLPRPGTAAVVQVPGCSHAHGRRTSLHAAATRTLEPKTGLGIVSWCVTTVAPGSPWAAAVPAHPIAAAVARTRRADRARNMAAPSLECEP